MTALQVLHNYVGDSIVICNAITHDDVAELFYKERHTVSQTEKQALATARMFAASYALYDALEVMEKVVSEAVEVIDAFNALNGTHLCGGDLFRLAKSLYPARAALALSRGEAA